MKARKERSVVEMKRKMLICAKVTQASAHLCDIPNRGVRTVYTEYRMQ